MPGCSAVGCSNRSEQGFALKVFPRDPNQRSVWEAKVKRTNWKANNNSYLCEVHFEADQWKDRVKKKLKKDAVPTLFSFIKVTTKRKSPLERMAIASKRLKSTDDSNDASTTINVESNNEETNSNTYIHADASTTINVESNNEETNSNTYIHAEIEKEDTIKELKLLLDEAKAKILELQEENRKLKDMVKSVSARLRKENLKQRCKTYKDKSVFAEDQLIALQSESMAYKMWSNSTVQTALGLRFSCGTKGYNQILKLNLPYPSVRTLQRRLSNVKFESGILYDIIKFLKIKIATFKTEQEKEAVLLLDEMSITPSADYDTSTNSYIGQSTLPNCVGNAKEALVFMIGGISTRWKQVVAYYFTNDSANGKSLKDEVIEVLLEVESIGFNIVSITSDMSSLNQAMWKSFGVGYSKRIKKPFIIHPLDKRRKIYFLADVPHLLKNIRSSLLNNSHFIIPENLKEKHNLPSEIVSASHIIRLNEMQCDQDLKLAPKLDNSQLNLGHFNKMKVGPARQVLSHEISCALKFLAEVEDKSNEPESKNTSGKGQLDEESKASLKTTAWFVAQISRWFELLSSRHPVMALSKYKPSAYEDSITFLREICDLFSNMKVVQKDGRQVWKPIQTGVLLTTNSILQLQKELIEEKKFHFVLTARFSQDALENLFSVVRMKQAIPTALEFKRNLKLICVAQYMAKSTTSNYDEDDRELLSGFLDLVKTPKKVRHEIVLPIGWDKENDSTLSNIERNCLFNVAGYIIHSIIKNGLTCNICISSLGSKEKDCSDDAHLVRIKEHKQNCLYYAKKEIFEMFLKMENVFRSLETTLYSTPNCKLFLTQIYSANPTISTITLPTCHNLKKRLINRYSTFRLKIFANKKKKEIKKKSTNEILKSKSIAMHNLADKV